MFYGKTGKGEACRMIWLQIGYSAQYIYDLDGKGDEYAKSCERVCEGLHSWICCNDAILQ
jgi:hypothetical protein